MDGGDGTHPPHRTTPHDFFLELLLVKLKINPTTVKLDFGSICHMFLSYAKFDLKSEYPVS